LPLSSRSVISRTIKILDWVGNSIERLIVVGFELARRTLRRFDPRTYFERLRIKQITEGEVCKPTGKFLVFVLYARRDLPSFTANFVAALNNSPFNLIVVSNTQLAASARRDLLKNCCLLIERKNIGRDFGGYKDGISVVFRRFQNIERLVIANDSVFYIDNGLDRLVTALDGPEDFVGISEVFEHHYHVASFLISFGPRVLKDPVFRRFWANYLPLQTRMWAIMKGEGELTKRLIDAGYSPHVLCKAEHLLPILQRAGASEFKEAMQLFSQQVRGNLSLRAAKATGTAADLATAAVAEVLQTNQMHAAGFLFMKYLGLPLFKRDIVYRELFDLPEVKRIVADLGIPMQPEIIADLDGRFAPTPYNVFRRLLYRHGFI
jgi:hypothetical protein